ncbi:MAG: hypothetical protein V4456_00185 [Bacteroidota bacterium]|jgi:hypothetical protein|uniref:hypothetical protein n=1 Tax=Mucilaginibacter inviolabilis TaxID=2714892 RepID=UPI001408AC2A|nr:hypothetical protein [Mucilaginibacter inviolabilis]NHA05771.1 hypothetical protein [Mucilaginibacter inviolabilis]
MKEIDELNQRINGVDELIDTLVKTNTDMERRQVKLEEHIENIKDLVPIIKAMESKTNYPEVYIPDYSEEFGQIFAEIQKAYAESGKETSTASFQKVIDKIDALNIDIRALAKRYFDPKTSWLLIICSILILLVAALTGTTMGFAFEAYEFKLKNNAENISTRDTVNRFSPNKTFKKHKMKAGRIKQFLHHTDKTE